MEGNKIRQLSQFRLAALEEKIRPAAHERIQPVIWDIEIGAATEDDLELCIDVAATVCPTPDADLMHKAVPLDMPQLGSEGAPKGE
jgi:hypothetical protein